MNHYFKRQIFSVALCEHCQSEVTELCIYCNEGLCENCHPAKIRKAKTTKDASKIGIHLLNPDDYEISDAQEKAVRDNFKTIWVHTKRTFGKVSK